MESQPSQKGRSHGCREKHGLSVRKFPSSRKCAALSPKFADVCELDDEKLNFQQLVTLSRRTIIHPLEDEERYLLSDLTFSRRQGVPQRPSVRSRLSIDGESPAEGENSSAVGRVSLSLSLSFLRQSRYPFPSTPCVSGGNRTNEMNSVSRPRRRKCETASSRNRIATIVVASPFAPACRTCRSQLLFTTTCIIPFNASLRVFHFSE